MVRTAPSPRLVFAAIAAVGILSIASYLYYGYCCASTFDIWPVPGVEVGDDGGDPAWSTAYHKAWSSLPRTSAKPIWMRVRSDGEGALDGGSKAATVADVEKMEFVKEMALHAWKGYVAHAWGADDLLPLAREPYNWYQPATLLNTAVDALSTLHLMNLTAEFVAAKALVLSHYTGTPPPFQRQAFGSYISVFETTIRVLGGLLSAYELDGDAGFVRAAEAVAAVLMPAFEAGEGKGGAPRRMPMNLVNASSGEAVDPFGGSRVVVLAQAGTLQLEFGYLADVTGKRRYAEAAMAAHTKLARLARSNVPGLVPMMLDSAVKRLPKEQDFGVGSLSDSYYEYLLKVWVATGDDVFLKLYHQAADALVTHMLQETPDGKFAFLPDLHSSGHLQFQPAATFQHLTCFTGGMFALGAVAACPNRPEPFHLAPRSPDRRRPGLAPVPPRAPATCRARELALAAKLTRTCHAAATLRASAGVGFEVAGFWPVGWAPADVYDAFRGDGDGPLPQLNLHGRMYNLRPETVESLFYMWRATGDPVWREMGWTIAQNINRHCRGKVGFHGLRDAFRPTKALDMQESFLLAETFKYLYLLFAGDDVLPLDQYVFNTEAHPLSVRGHGRRKDLKWGTRA